MDNENKKEEWLDDILGAAPVQKEIELDEEAIAFAKLIHPKDRELEQIMSEHKADDITDVIEAAVAQQIYIADTAANEPIEPAQSTLDSDTQLFTPQVTEELFPPQPEEIIPADHDEDPMPEDPEFELPPRKGRPKRKSGYGMWGIPHLLSTAIWLILIVSIGVSLGRTLWLCCSDLMAFGKKEVSATITITDSDTIDTIAEALAERGLIRYPGLFKTFAELTGKVDNISVGTFTLGSHLDYNAMINGMSAYAQARKEVNIMFPEGYTCAQMFALLEENEVCTVAELEEYAANGELEEFWFLEGVERGDKYCLEGYLFPDTYTFYTNDEPGRVLEKFLYAFDARFTDIMRERLMDIKERHSENLADEGYDQDYIDEHEITIREIVIIASLIEKESAGGEESYDVSSVIYNRLEESSFPPYLNIDAAVIYGLGGNVDPITGEVKELSKADLEKDTPYNTYLHTGLTPGPISNPGQESLNAALTPNDTDYFYYALDPSTGRHKFFVSSRDFERFLESVEY